MKKLKKKIILSSAMLSMLSGAIAPSTVAFADDNDQYSVSAIQKPSSVSAEFDLSNLSLNGDTKTIVDDQGNVTNFKVETASNPLLRISNGSHKVSAWGLNWHVTFYINVKNNKITSANNLNYTIIGIAIKSSSLRVENSKRATAHFEATTPIWDVLSWTGWVRATINSSNKLVITNN
ncbi:DUF5626 family protein [Lactococcus muris]|uniref:DUF5626 family protein n=1 Tax=Lactococcus muris TaxID=2941330 RepID=A0ABV4DB90_9LACT|nr:MULTISPECIES: DUF5626 family protein [Lactococcus]